MQDEAFRATVARAVTITGKSLHAGRPARLQFLSAAPGSGVRFRCPGPDGPVEVPATLDCVIDARNATTLGHRGARVRTAEHVLAALVMAGIEDVLVDLDGDEPPAVDGSAAPFVEDLRKAGRLRQGGRRRLVEVVRPIRIEQGERSISVEPAPAFAVDYEIDFDAPAIGRQRISLDAADGVRLALEIAPARTFGLLGDVDRLRAAGLARGAGLDNTVVVDGERILNPGGLRFPDEPVRHKVLDLIGDLALLGMPLIGRVCARRGGHALHHALLRRLREETSSWRIVEPVAGPRAQSA